MKSFVLGVIFLLASYHAAGETPLKALIDAIFADFQKDNSPGCSIAVTRNGEVTFATGKLASTIRTRVYA